MQQSRGGFTIVELLIVIVVIGILAAITTVAYNGLQTRARTAAAQALANQVTKKITAYYVTNGSYPTDLTAADVPTTTDLQYSFDNTTSPASFCVTAASGNVSYFSSSTQGTPQSGGCPGHGKNGATAVVNLVPNPSVEANTTGWSYRWYGTLGGAGTNGRQTTGGSYGSAHLRKTWTVAGAAADNGFNTSLAQIQVTAGNSYTISGSLRTNRSDVTGRIGVAWYDSTNTVLGSPTTTWYTSSTLSANTWRRYTQTVTAPANATSMVAIFSNSNSVSWAVGDTFDFDGAMVSEAASNYADGNTTDWVWDGTPNNSTSRGPAI